MFDWRQILYSIVMLIALLAGFVVLKLQQRDLQVSKRERLAIGLAAFIGAMLGAKLPFLGSLGWQGFIDGRVWFTDGKTILGGIFGGYFAVEVVKGLLDIRTRTGDSFAMGIATAVAIGRIGCFIAGCCYGSITDLPWGIAFPFAGDAPSIMRHPTQLYEVAFHLLAITFLWVAAQQHWCDGHRLKAYLLGYLVYRFFTEWIRPEAKVLGALTGYQWACVIMAMILIGLWWRDSREPSKETDADRLRSDAF